MKPTMPALGIRFDLGKVASNLYEYACWKVFWHTVDVKQLRSTLLFEGDTDATLKGRENVFCIALQPLDPTILGKIRSALEQCPEFQRLAASPKFIENDLVIREPLLEAGQVDAAGDLIGKAYSPRAALEEVWKENKDMRKCPLFDP
jgi:hypothetical protein